MQQNGILLSLQKAKQQGKKQLAVLIDPDKTDAPRTRKLVDLAVRSEVNYFLVGGSLLWRDRLDTCLRVIRERCAIPTLLFPGSTYQINPRADGILFLSLISGRNPDLLIGQHVISAPYLRDSPLEVLGTGYLLIDGGAPTTVSYMSNTQPIPADKPEIAASTALAGAMLGLRLIYLDAGSGARQPVSENTIKVVSRTVDTPLIVGGGIRTPERAVNSLRAGADLVVVGNAFEKDPELLPAMAAGIAQLNAAQREIA